MNNDRIDKQKEPEKNMGRQRKEYKHKEKSEETIEVGGAMKIQKKKKVLELVYNKNKLCISQ
jgi:hypothetical protein